MKPVVRQTSRGREIQTILENYRRNHIVPRRASLVYVHLASAKASRHGRAVVPFLLGSSRSQRQPKDSKTPLRCKGESGHRVMAMALPQNKMSPQRTARRRNTTKETPIQWESETTAGGANSWSLGQGRLLLDVLIVESMPRSLGSCSIIFLLTLTRHSAPFR